MSLEHLRRCKFLERRLENTLLYLYTYYLVYFGKLVTTVADIGVRHGRKWRFERGGEWLIALSEYVGEPGNVGKVLWAKLPFTVVYEYSKLTGKFSLIWEVPIHIATAYVKLRPK